VKKSHIVLSDKQKEALLSKEMRAILLNQPPGKRSYEEALQKHYGQTYNASNRGQALRRKTEQVQRAVRDLALLAQSLPPDKFVEAFATEDFLHMMRSVVGAGEIDEQAKALQRKVEQVRDSVPDIIDDERAKSEQNKEESLVNRILRRDEYKELERANSALDAVMPIALNPLKAEIASDIAKAALDCCIEQYKRLQRDPVTIELYEELIRKAATITEAIVREIKKNVEQVSLQHELQEYKAKEENRKRKGSNLTDH
jgi:hypothetical protein